MARIAIVTGADTAVGRAVAVALAGEGCDIGLLWATHQREALATAEAVRAAGRPVADRRVDLADAVGVTEGFDELADVLGGLDVFVNNTAVPTSSGPFLDLAVEEWEQRIAMGLTSAFVCAQRAAKRLIRQGRGGRIVLVTSVYERVALYGGSAFCAAQAGLGMLTKVLALELAEHGITVNVVAPGEVAEPSSGDRPGIPMGRAADPREIAHAVAFLSSSRAGYATGTSLVVDGGLLLTTGMQT